MKTYYVSSDSRDYTTRSARRAAEIACCWRRAGVDVSAYVVHAYDRIHVDRIQVTTVRETERQLVSVK